MLAQGPGDPSIAAPRGYLSSPTGSVPKCDLRAPRAWSMDGYRRLPMNRYAPVMQALSEGTLVLSVDASLWGQYGGGVFDKCQPNAIPNHAVLGVGYGTDPDSGLKYYLIRNSWSETWGEHDVDPSTAPELTGISKAPHTRASSPPRKLRNWLISVSQRARWVQTRWSEHGSVDLCLPSVSTSPLPRGQGVRSQHAPAERSARRGSESTLSDLGCFRVAPHSFGPM